MCVLPGIPLLFPWVSWHYPNYLTDIHKSSSVSSYMSHYLQRIFCFISGVLMQLTHFSLHFFQASHDCFLQCLHIVQGVPLLLTVVTLASQVLHCCSLGWLSLVPGITLPLTWVSLSCPRVLPPLSDVAQLYFNCPTAIHRVVLCHLKRFTNTPWSNSASLQTMCSHPSKCKLDNSVYANLPQWVVTVYQHCLMFTMLLTRVALYHLCFLIAANMDSFELSQVSHCYFLCWFRILWGIPLPFTVVALCHIWCSKAASWSGSVSPQCFITANWSGLTLFLVFNCHSLGWLNIITGVPLPLNGCLCIIPCFPLLIIDVALYYPKFFIASHWGSPATF